MEGVITLKCDRCGCEMATNDSYQYLRQTLCEDCYIDTRYPAKACDPWAVYSATKSRENQGLEGTEGLTELQKQICEMVREKGKVTGEQLMEYLGLTEAELQTQLATLRHCELVKGHKEGNRVYLVPYDGRG